MTFTLPAARPVPEQDLVDSDRHRRQIAASVRLAMKGQINSSIFVTLDPSVATTTVIDARVSGQTCASFCPTSASAAAEVPTLWVEASNGQIVIHHTNSAVTDRTFTMGIIG